MNFNLGKKIYTAGLEKKFNVLILGIFLNLALLSYFKYANFFIENINYIFSYYNLQTIENVPHSVNTPWTNHLFYVDFVRHC